MYENLEEKIAEAIKLNHGRLPITLTSGDGSSLNDITTIDPDDVIGSIVTVTENLASCELNLAGTELLLRGSLFGKGVQFCYLADDSKVDRVIKAAIAPMISSGPPPIKHVDGGVTIVRGGEI